MQINVSEKGEKGERCGSENRKTLEETKCFDTLLLETHTILRMNLVFSLSDTSECQPTDLCLAA